MPRLFLLPAVSLSVIFFLSGCGPNPGTVKANSTDTTAPDPVTITGRLTGGGGESSAGAQVPGGAVAQVVLLNSTAGQLEITATATDLESGIVNLEIFSTDRVCNWNSAFFVAAGFGSTTNIRSSIRNAPDSNGMVPTKAVAIANINVTAERGTFDTREWRIFGFATNSSGRSVTIGPLSYKALSSGVPAAHRLDACL